jgi:hypothetical protein
MKVTTLEQDIEAQERPCRECGEPTRWANIDHDQYDYYSDLGEIVICRECSEEDRRELEA